MERNFLLRVLLLLCVTAVARAAVPVVASPLGWPWGAVEQDVQKDYPPTPGYPLKHHYRGSLELMGERLEDVSVRFIFKGGGLHHANVSIPPDVWRRLTSTFESKYGKPRYATTREHKVFTHYLEWSNPDFGITASITTVGDDLNGQVYGRRNANIEFVRGPISASTIDAIEKSHRQAHELQERMRLESQKAEAERSRRAMEPNKRRERPPPPTEEDAIRWAQEAGERLQRADCPTEYERRFDSFEQIFAAPGDRGTKALLDAGFSTRELYYGGGIPTRCAQPNSIARPLIVRAMLEQNAASVKLLAKRGADIEYMPLEEMCLVEEAAWRSSAEVFRVLLAAGARCTAKPNGRRDVIREVVWRQPVEKLKVLLDYKFRLEVDDLRTLTVSNDLAKVRLAIKHGYKWSAKELDLSTLMASPEMLALLIRGGADSTALLRRLVSRDFSYGKLPNESHCVDRARVLLENGARVSMKGTLFPEIAAALRRAPESMRKLLAAAAERELPRESTQPSSEASRHAL
jgi:hypothetical protein